MGAALGVGAALQLGGAILGGEAAQRTKQQLNNIAETPGIDSQAVTMEALRAMLANTPLAQEVVREQNTFNQGEMDRLMELRLPGFGALQKQRMNNAASLSRGELPPDVAALVQRKAASKAVAGGYGGSGAARNLTLRDFGITSLQAMEDGDRLANSVIGSSPVAEIASLARYSGLTPQELIGMRSAERYDRMDRKTLAAGAPSRQGVWGKSMQDAGGALSGI